MGDYIEENNLGNPRELAIGIYFAVILIPAAVGIYLIGEFAPNVVAIIGGFVLGAAGWRVSENITRNLYYREIAQLKTPVFITSFGRGDQSVFERYTQAKKDISAAWVVDPNRPVPPVYVLYWGEGGESDGEYFDRRDIFKVEKTKEYHAAIMRANYDYYVAVILGQNGATYQAVNN